jgi:hypothetical protein
MHIENWMGYAIAVTALVMVYVFLIRMLTTKNLNVPTVQDLQALATVFSTKGGFIFMLLIMWFSTLTITIAFGVWVIWKGIDPQHAVVVTILGMLVSQAFGNVNGALFTAFKGDDPKAPPGISTQTSTTEVTATTEVQAPVVAAPVALKTDSGATRLP